MKVVCDISVTSAASHRGGGPAAPWDLAWQSPTSATPAALVMDFAAGVYGAGGTLGSLATNLSLIRSTSATRTDSAGVLSISPANTARIDHDPVSMAPLGLLSEAARTNQIVQSGSPAFQSIAVSAVPHVLSFYGSGTVTLANAHTATVNGAGSYPARTELAFTPAAGTLDVSFAGDVFAPQLEQGSRASSYIPTTTTAAPRDADNVTVPLGAWFGAAAGTVVFSGVLNDAVANDRIIEIDGGDASNRLSVLWNTVLGKPQFQVWSGGALQAAIAPAGNSIALGDPFRVAIAYAANDFAVSLNGGAVAQDVAGILPAALTTMRIGRAVSGAQGMLTCESLVHYATRLADAELQALSA